MINSACQLMIKTVNPSILIRENFLVLWIRVLRLIEWSHGSLEIGFNIRLEEVRENLLLWGRDILEVVDTLVKDCLHYLTYFSWRTAVFGSIV